MLVANYSNKPNVDSKERILSLMGGSLLLMDSLIRRKIYPMELTIAGYLFYRGLTGHCPAYRAMDKIDYYSRGQNINIRTRLVVSRPRAEVYAFWRKLDNLPLFMKHLEKVTVLDDKLSEWTIKIPGGIGTLSWTSEIVKEKLNDFIGWQSQPGSAIEHAGKIDFRDAENGGTEIHVLLTYHAPAGALGENVVKLFTPLFKNLVKEDVEGFKWYMEHNDHYWD